MSFKHTAQLSGIAAILLLTTTASAADDPRLLESRSLTKFFGSRLQADLKEAMSTGGPVAAINVCKDAAPHIAAELSRMSGAKVSRTSLRFRNPRNAPESWQAVILEEFDARSKNAETTAQLQHFAVAADSSARYMKAIPTGPVCLVCHGKNLAPECKQRWMNTIPTIVHVATSWVRFVARSAWYGRARLMTNISVLTQHYTVPLD